MSLFKSAATISALTLASRITGVIRDMLIARYFGATAATDAFYVAFRLPNMLRRLFAEGAFQQAFVPMLSDVHANSSPEAEKRFIDYVFTVLAAAVLLASVLGVLAAPLLVWLIASGLRETPQAFGGARGEHPQYAQEVCDSCGHADSAQSLLYCLLGGARAET